MRHHDDRLMAKDPGWWSRWRYARHGRRDGRLDLPVAGADPASPSPTLHRLTGQVRHRVNLIDARRVRTIADDTVELAQLLEPGGELARAEQRLSEMERRLAELVAAGIDNGRRHGEQNLSAELVVARRKREFDRATKRARKRLEDERTAVAALRRRIHELRQRILNAERQAAADARLVGRAEAVLATSYFDGVVRTHTDRAAVTAQLARSIPGVSR